VTDQFMISAFWPPTESYVNETQYDYLQEANFNYVQNVNSTDLLSKDTNLKMAKLAYERGIEVGVCDSRFSEFMNMTDQEIQSIVGEYANVPGVGGFYIRDEPVNANPFARIYKAIKAKVPYSFPYLNFLPMLSSIYATSEIYTNQMDDFAETVGLNNIEYLMYDRYPFGDAPDSLDYNGMLSNMEACYKAGMENDVKTGLYIQSIGRVNEDGSPAGFRKTNGNEVRYEVFAALAYGYKQLSYFTWFTPTGRPETFTSGIIAPDGTKSELFESVKEINGQVMQLSDTLMQLNAKQIYFSGADTYWMTVVPENFFVHSKTNDNVMLSYLRDKNTGRNYLMVVNNDFVNEKDISLEFVDGITSLEEVSKENGSYISVNGKNKTYTLHFLQGEGRLFALPKSYDYEANEETPAVDVNLALNANVSASVSKGENGWYLGCVTDGKCFSKDTSNGWQATVGSASEGTQLVLDLHKTRAINRVDMYPAGNVFNYGDAFPKSFTIDVSKDGNSWETVKTVSDYPKPKIDVPSFTFDMVNARYVRFNITAVRGYFGSYSVQLSEIKIYNDDGTVAAPALPPTVTDPVSFVPGMNLALGRPLATSASGEYPQWGWSTSFLNDGQKGKHSTTNGWTSATGTHFSQNSNEWMAVYLGDTYLVDKIVMYPRNMVGDSANAGLAFPTDYTVSVSTDGENWNIVKQVTNDITISAEPRIIELDTPVTASFIKFNGTKLKLASSAADGYLMQVGEFEVYGNPVCDKTALDKAIADAGKILESYTTFGWNDFSAALQAAEDASASQYTTQVIANKLTVELICAQTALVLIINKSSLLNSINDAEILNEESYTASSWATLTAALVNAKNMASGPEVDQTSIDKASDELQTAITNLELKSSEKLTEQSPDTGDSSPLWYAELLLFFSLLGIAAVKMFLSSKKATKGIEQ